MHLKGAVLLALVGLAVAAPTTNSLHKRSFKAPTRGRTFGHPLDDVDRVHKKYGWVMVVSEPVTTSPASELVYPFSPVTTQAAGTTVYEYAVSTVFATTPTGYVGPPPPDGLGNSTVSAVAAASTASPSGISSSNSTEDGEVTANPEENEIEYLSPVTIGGQTLNLNFDTGSADLWVFSSELAPRFIDGHTVYDPFKSSTYTELEGATWLISYGDNSGASGIVGFDTVDVGGSTVEKQCIELATRVSTAFVQDPNADGLLGLAWSSINQVRPEKQKTFFENVMNDLSEPLFTADLEDDMGKGTYEFGVIDQAKYKGDIHYVGINNTNGFWQLTIPSVTIDGEESTSVDGSIPVIADTGTSLLYLESAVVEEYYSNVEGATTYTGGVVIYPCNSTLPSLGLQIGEYNAVIAGEDMTYLEFDPSEDGESLAGMCMGGLQEGPSTIQILGASFLKHFFAVFDGGNLQFGVAEKDEVR